MQPCPFHSILTLFKAKDYPSLWVHIDAAWAGVALSCPEHREKLYLEEINAFADSFCANFHKVSQIRTSYRMPSTYELNHCSGGWSTLTVLLSGLEIGNISQRLWTSPRLSYAQNTEMQVCPILVSLFSSSYFC
jgi:hypothetical protein